MRTLILSQWYSPEPAYLVEELALSLQARGHNVTVLTGFPNYPSGKLYPGYRLRLWQRQLLNNISVIRVPLYPNHDLSKLRRILNYVSFALSAAMLGPWLAPRPDVIFVYHPPLTIGIPAYILSRIWRVPFVYQIQDMWPETLSATGMIRNPRFLGWINKFAKWLYRKATAICVSTPGFRENLLSKGVPSEKVFVISHWIDTEVFRNVNYDAVLAQELGLSNHFNVMFAGNMGEAQGLETLVEAAVLLRDRLDIQFVLVGDGVALPRLRALAQERRVTCIRLLGPYSLAQMPKIYALADVLLIHLKDNPLFRITIPSRTFAYMASGKPILAAVEGDAAKVVSEAGAGVTCSPQDPQAMASMIRLLHSLPETQRRKMGESGLAAAREKYSREIVIGKIENLLYNQLAQVRGANPLYLLKKRLLDLILTIPTLILLLPALVLLVFLVRLLLGSPVLFKQQRPGLNGKPFTLLKFRTMTHASDALGNLLPDAQRMTPLGRVLRATSLDELPELLNVLKGEMSLVGPRPLLMEYLDRYTPEQARRHEVKPGLTGWAQVNGRNAISWEQKFKLDIWYVDHMSLWLDIKILLLTVWKVLRREGISQPGQATMEEFLG